MKLSSAPVSSALFSTRTVAAPHSTVIDALEAGAKRHAPFVTFHTEREPVSRDFARVLEHAHAWSTTLRRNGVSPRASVLLLMPTGPAFIEAFFGVLLAGAVPVPLASPMTFGSMSRYLRNLAAIAADAGARHLIASPRVRDAVARDEALTQTLQAVFTEPDSGSHHDGFAPSIDATDLAFIQYTSGTTGHPKGVMVSHRALVSNAFAIADGLHLSERDVGVSWLPLFHDMGLIGVMLTAVCHPYPLHVLSPERFVMRPGAWTQLLSSMRGTISAAPNFGYELCASKAAESGSLQLEGWRLALNGSEPVHRTTTARFATRFANAGFTADAMLPVYGMAESTLAVTFTSPGEGVSVLRIDRAALQTERVARPSDSSDAYEAVCVGSPVAGMCVRVTGDDGHTASEDIVGEIQIRGPSLMSGYFGNDEATAEAMADGWLRSGDLGFVHDGRLYVIGRAKEVIIKAGRNIYPYDVERIAAEVKGVRPGSVAAFARSNSDAGTDDLVVIAETSVQDSDDRDRMRKEIRGELLAVLGVRADEVHLCAPGALPRTTSGKIRRSACVDLIGVEAN